MKQKLKPKWHKLDSAGRMHGISTPIIGLTGGIASGKSTVAQYLTGQGFCIISADALVKKIYQKQDTVAYISKEYPEVMKDGAIDFKSLRKIFFGNPVIQQKIEQFIYARMKDAFLEEMKGQKNPEVLIYDVPLLFEKKLDQLVDVSICVYCPRSLQIKRLIKRDGIDEKMAEKILSTQMDIEQKRTRSDFTIENNTSIESAHQNVDRIMSEIFD